MARFQTCLPTLVTCLIAFAMVTAAFAGAAAADSSSPIDSVDSTEEEVDEENGDDGNDEETNGDEEESDEETNGDEEESDDGNGADDPAPAEFRIADVEPNTPITVGETISVTVDVENAGEEAGSEDVWFELDEYLKDEETVSLSPGESTSVTLSYVSKSGDAGDWSLTAGTPHDTSTDTVTIEERDDGDDEDSSNGGSGSGWGGSAGSASFDVRSFNATDSATVGDVVHFNASVENTGTAGEEKLVWFSVDGTTVNRTELDLDRGSDRTLTYAYNTSELENGTHEVAVETPDGIETREMELEPRRSELRVDAVEINETVEAGEHIDATVDLHNAGNATATTNVTLLFGEHHIDSAPVSVAPNESTTIQLTYRTNAGLTGDLDFVVDADDTQEPFSVTVAEPTPDPTPTAEQLEESADTPTPTESTASTPEDATGTNDTVPGFGAVPTLVALLLASVAVLARRRRR